jgi:rSAM/selenodomain-associated transferase 1
MSKNALIIFTRKPEKGKVKTRLAKDVGKDKALEIYVYLLRHSANISSKCNAEKQVWYTNSIEKNDIWNDDVFKKHTQPAGDLGQKMKQAFLTNFNNKFEKVVIIGTDLLDINTQTIENAFQLLDKNDVVIGPAEDGGYYLLGINQFIPEIFENIEWSTDKVLKQTLNRLADKKVKLLEEKNDIDYKEDAVRHEALANILK